MSRRDARAQRVGTTGEQRTIWSTASAPAPKPVASAKSVEVPEVAASVIAPTPVSEPDIAPLAESVVAEPVAVAEASEVPAAGVPAAEAETVIAAPVVATHSRAEHAAPMTRASRRIRTAPTPITPEPEAVVEEQIPALAEPAAAFAEAVAVAASAVVVDAGEPGADVAADQSDAVTVESSEPAAAEPVVPAAAIAWAAAAAAAAAETQVVAPVEPVLAPAEPFELLEPVAVEPIAEAEEIEPDAESRAGASDVDEFEVAARLFSFTGETPIQSEAADADAEPAEEQAPAAEPVAHVATRRRSRNVGRQIATASFSVGVMGIVGLLTVGMTTPADAVAAVTGTEPTSLVAAMGTDAEVDPEDIQAYVAPGDIENASLERNESYSIVSMGEIAAEEGITNHSNFFVNDPNAAIQWPFAVGVPITYGFGMRSGRMHEGADFVPGQGADVQAIAEGTVRVATNSGGAYGVTVVIDHIIDGQLVSSRYAHMLYGSLKVTVGQHVSVGTILGNTGNTGRSYGAHTHFEILQGGTTAVDPIAWLRKYAGRYSLDHW